MFRLVKILNGRINETEPVKLKTKSGVAYEYGTALGLSAGTLINCTATTKPLYICGEDAKADEKAEITVYPIDPNQIFEAPISVAPTSSVVVGAKLTLALTDSKATGVTATTTDGVAEVFDVAGATAANDKILVRIV